MHALLIILSCHVGLLAAGFILAGFAGMLDLDREMDKAEVLDHLFFGGFISCGLQITRNWPARRTERRFVYAGAACAAVCAILLVLLRLA